MPARPIGALVIVTILALSDVGCGKTLRSPAVTATTPPAAAASTATAGSSITGAPAPPAEGTIVIHDFMFQPSPATAKVGETVTVTNEDGTDHSVTADNGSFTTGVFSGGTKTFVITTPGTLSFHCQIHNFMHGTIVVSG